MLELILLFVFGMVAYRQARAIAQQRDIFLEFGLNLRLAVLVWLFPLAPVILFVGLVVLKVLVVALLAVGCFIAALLLARKQGQVLQKAGTDRVKGAQSAVEQVFGTALAGLCYVVISFAMAVAPMAIQNYR